MRRSEKILIGLTIFLSAFFFFWRIWGIPASLDFDVMIVAQNGHFFWEKLIGKTHPISQNVIPYVAYIIPNWEYWSAPLAVTLSGLWTAIFGLHQWSIFSLSAFFGFLTIIIFLLYLIKINKNIGLACLGAIILATSTWPLNSFSLRSTFQ